MNGKTTDYTVASEHDCGALISKVNDLIKEGFEPLGGIQMVAPVLNGDEVAPLYAQAMVKKKAIS